MKEKRGHQNGSGQIVAISGERKSFPVSSAQRRFWLLNRFAPAQGGYTVDKAVRVKGPLQVWALEKAFIEIQRRHESLRTTFELRDDDLCQIIHAPGEIRLHVEDLNQLCPAVQEEKIRSAAEAETFAPFDLTKGPLLRVRLLRLADDEHIMLLAMHHIICDGWSIAILLNELGTLYEAFNSGRTSPLPELPIQYSDFAVWQRQYLRGEEAKRQRSYWMRQLQEMPSSLSLRTDRARSSTRSRRGEMESIVLPASISSSARLLARKYEATLSMVLLSAFNLLLFRYTHQQDFAVGSPIANRRRSETEPLIGAFINTLVFRAQLASDLRVRDLITQVRSTSLEAYANQDLPFEEIVEDLNPERGLNEQPLFQVMFIQRNEPAGAIKLPDLELTPLAHTNLFSPLDLELSVHEIGDELSCWMLYDAELFDRSSIRQMLRHFRNIVVAMVQDNDKSIGTLEFLEAHERQQILYAFNQTRAGFSKDKYVHQLFEEKAEQCPEALAAICDGTTITYGELNRNANRVARHLRNLGVGPDVRVGVCFQPGMEMLAALLGVLKSGGVYVPLDPGYPEERLRYVVEDSTPRVLLVQSKLRERFAAINANLPLQDLTDLREQAGGWDTKLESADTTLSPENLAYIIYTSGSSGTPKGVMIDHRAIRSQIEVLQSLWQLSAQDRMLQFASISFDVSIEEIFCSLISGALLVLRTGAWLSSAGEFFRLCEKEKVSVVDLPTRFWQQLLVEELPLPSSIRLVTIGGEAVEQSSIATWFTLYGSRTRLFNAYGPTETTINATVQELTYDPLSWRSIGMPIEGVQMRVLDMEGELTPIGVVGELYIGGMQVARGYLNRADLTAERILPDPYSDEPGARMYRTGDLGCWLANGTIEFLGRNDQQVKIRGYRIELGEIEATLLKHAQVEKAAAVAREVGGEKRLVAYFTAREQELSASVQPAELRQFLGTKLPRYMIPGYYVRLDQLPLTANGKLDVSALPLPEPDPHAAHYEAPEGETETILAGIWAELLKVERVGRYANFFELGGHSLLGVRMASRVQQRFGVAVTIGDLFARPVLADLAASLKSDALAARPPIKRIEERERLPLSFAQQRLWFLATMEGASEAYHIPIGLRLKGALNRVVLRQALDQIVRRHEVLRTRFIAVDGNPVQCITPASESRFHIVEHDLQGHSNPKRTTEYLAQSEAEEAFNLETGPLIRGRLIRYSENEHTLLITVHHIIADEWSAGIFLDELSRLYQAFIREEQDPLPELVVQYADYASWERHWIEGEIGKQQAEYWIATLKDAPALLELPTDYGRLSRQDYQGAFEGLALSEELTSNLKALSRRQGTTLYMTVLAGWVALLARLSGQPELVVGTPVANREQAEIESLIGFFVNTLALRMDLSGSPSVTELLRRVKNVVIGAQRSQNLPFEQVVEMVSSTRSLAHSPLFQSMVAWQKESDAKLTLPGIEVTVLESIPHRTAKFDLTLLIGEKGRSASGGIEFATALFEAATIRRFAGYFSRLLESMTRDAAQAVDCLPLLSQEERRQVVFGWNHTAKDFPHEKYVHELFEDHVAKTPEAVAVEYNGQRLTYRELNRRSNQIGHYLRKLGVGPDARVGICMERCPEMIVGLLAILKAGGAYVPLDPAYPAERLGFMAENSKPKVLLTQPHLRGIFHDLKAMPVVELHNADLWNGEPETNLDRTWQAFAPERLVYVIYTSGSTGRPKGVAMPTAAAVNLLCWQIDQSKVVSAGPQRTLQFAALGFDVSFQETFSTLCSGGVLVLVEEAKKHNATALAQFVIDQQIQRIFIPYVGLKILTEGLVDLEAILDNEGNRFDCKLQEVIVAGEQLHIDSRTREVFGRLNGCVIQNHYGPTETHVVTSYCLGPRSEEWQAMPPIGQPIYNAQIYILDKYWEPVPIGVIGELYLGGVGVARGYLDRPEMTAERFVADLFALKPGARMYKTGDRGRWLANGMIEFVGRNDDQVKIRGYRIEPGEIEAQLTEHPGVREAAVVVREDVPGEKRLVAYYTTAGRGDAKKAIPPETLRGHLVNRLPEHMVPAKYVYMEQMPLSANGKLNRKALPAPEGDASASSFGYEAPEGEMERALAEIWSDLLHVKQIGRRDNFFTLGGHSLLAVRLVARVQRGLGLAITVGDLFSRPVLADLAQGLKVAAQIRLPAITRVVRDGLIPLSFAQQRLWFLAKMEGSSEAYHIPFGLRLVGGLNRDVLQRALDRVVERHEALRTTFVTVDGVPAQKTASSEGSRFHLMEHDLRRHQDAGRELERLMREEAKAQFDLETGPLIRGRLVRESDNEYALLITMHHIVSDGWSIAVLCNEVVQLYEAFLHRKGDPLPELRVQYADYAVWQRQWMTGEEIRLQGDYWKTVLQDAPTLLELPTDHSRPAQQDYRGAFEELALEQELAYGLKDFSKRHGTTVYMTLLAGWAVLLQRLSGQRDVVVGTPTANRGHAEIEGLIGFFVNTLALRLNVLGTLRVSELVAHVKSQVLGAQQHQDIPFEHVVDIVRPVRSLAHTPIFQVMFSWLNAPEARPEFVGLTTKPLNSVPHHTAKFDLMLSLKETDEKIAGGMEYATALFEESTIRRFKGYLCRLLEAMVVDDEQPVSCLAMLSDLERRQVLYGWNEDEVQVPQGSLQQLFEQQAYRQPEAVAVECGGQVLSYGELELRANQMAHYLWEMGVRPEVRVGLCVPRSLEMLIGMLGILKAGGVYVPLDPGYPLERIQYMVEDSQAILVVSTRSVKSSFGVRVMRLDEEWEEITQRSGESLSVRIDGENLAYVIYTSGSTGRPKGAGIRHSSAVALMEWVKEEYNAEEISVVLAATSLCFDLSVFEIFVPLSLGGKVTIVENALDLAGLATKDGVTLVNTVPSAMAELVQHSLPKSVRVVNLAGEALSATLVKQVYDRLGNVRVMNLYGPTEDTTYSTYEWVTREEAKKGKVSIGRPVANTQAYVLDAEYQPAGIGIVGELYLGGAGLARGYVNRPDLTAEKFVPHPYSKAGGERLYRTGDLVRWTESGKLEFLGRADHQVKIRGYRIELGEIEAALLQHGKINEAVVVVREDLPGNKHLVAYYTERVGAEGNTRASADDLRHYLQERLPGYAAPAFYVQMERLPLTPNGKVDRKALPATYMEHGNGSGAISYVAPRTSMESLVAQVWEQVLGVERAGVKDDFFALGGHSLSAMRVSALIEARSGKRLPLTELFRNPTIEYLAALLEGKKEDTGPSCLVPIRSEGSRPPLFLVHPVGGTVYCYQRLAGLANIDRPIYGFQTRAFAGLPPQSSISEMAQTYINEMIAVQPRGSYFLGGWSMGGVVAFEMALQLAAQNLPVGLLALIDSYPNTVDTAADSDDHSDAFFNFARDLGISTQELLVLRETAGTFTEKQLLTHLIELAKKDGVLPADLDNAEADRMFDFFKINSKALRNYVPRECYRGPTLLLKAESSVGDLAKVWGAFCSRIESHVVPGDHYEIFKDPGIQILARHLDLSLDRQDAALMISSKFKTQFTGSCGGSQAIRENRDHFFRDEA
jgi:amino acid adenylation domain-containing protein